MTAFEKAYIASRYHDYAQCLPQFRQPEKAAAIRQLMDFFGIEEMGADTEYFDDSEGENHDLYHR